MRRSDSRVEGSLISLKKPFLLEGRRWSMRGMDVVFYVQRRGLVYCRKIGGGSQVLKYRVMTTYEVMQSWSENDASQ